jgi:hypothetical protein
MGAWNRINVQMAAGASAASMPVLVAAMRMLGHEIKRFLRCPGGQPRKQNGFLCRNDSLSLSLSLATLL